MNTNHMNDIDYLYDKPVENLKDGKFGCPVCGASYATRAGIFNHMKKRECAPVDLLFKDTVTEEVGLKLYANTVGSYNRSQRTQLPAFRKSKYYKGVLKLALHCMTNRVDGDLYMSYIEQAKKPRYYNHALSLAMKDTTLVDFRNHLIKNEELIDSEAFFEQNEEKCLKEPWFLIRALQRGDIGLDFCLDHPVLDLANQADSWGEANRIHLLSVIKTKEG